MSFILDALKKAESERSRHSGPVLMDVRVRARRQRLPTWAWVLGCVLLANLLMLVWLLLKPEAPPPAVATTTVAATPSVAAPQAAPPPALPPPSLPLSLPAAPPPAAQSVAESAPAIAAPLPAALPAVVLPVVPAAITPPFSPVTTAPPGADNLPTMQDLVNSGVTLPTLRMSLHVYDELPGNRYVLLNSRRLREGDQLPEGGKVERITPRGVVLDVGGHRFLLNAGG